MKVASASTTTMKKADVIEARRPSTTSAYLLTSLPAGRGCSLASLPTILIWLPLEAHALGSRQGSTLQGPILSLNAGKTTLRGPWVVARQLTAASNGSGQDPRGPTILNRSSSFGRRTGLTK